MKIRFLTLVCAMLAWTGMKAQQNTESEGTMVSRSMTIEGTYNPSVTQAQKQMPVPQKPQVEAEKQPVSYILDVKPLSSYVNDAMTPIGRTAGERYEYVGLARLGYGMRNNLDGMLDLGLDFTDRDMLRLNWGMNGWNTVTVEDPDWRSRMFDMDASAAYVHATPDLSVGVHGGFGVERFNYRHLGTVQGDGIPRQFLLRGEAGIFLASTDIHNLTYSLDARWKGLSAENVGYKPDFGREDLLRIDGSIALSYGEGKVGLDYYHKSAFFDWRTRVGDVEYDNYTTLSLSPYMTWSNDEIEALAGVDLNLHTDNGELFQIAPRIEASYRWRDKIMLFANYNGGIQDYDMRYMFQFSPYWAESRQIMDGYTLVNLQIGATFTPADFCSLSLTAGDKVTLNDLFQTVDSVALYDAQGDNKLVVSGISQNRSNMLYAELTGQVSVQEWFSGDFLFGAYKWDVKESRNVLVMRPVLKTEGHIRTAIQDDLYFDISYRYHLMSKYNDERLKPLNDLGFALNYTYRYKTTFTLKGTNLLDRGYYMYAGYPVEMWSLTGGVTYRF